MNQIGMRIGSTALMSGFGYIFGKCCNTNAKLTALIWGVATVTRQIFQVAYSHFSHQPRMTFRTFFITQSLTAVGIGIVMNRLGLITGVARTALTMLAIALTSIATTCIVGHVAKVLRHPAQRQVA